MREQLGKGVDLFLLPEVCLTGFSSGKSLKNFTEESEQVQQVAALAKEHSAHLLAGFRIQEGEKAYNRTLLFSPAGKTIARYDKRVLFSYWKEQKLFSAGKSPFSTSLGRFQLAAFTCYELRFPELFRAQKEHHLMVVIANWPIERRHHWLTLLRARAIENQCYVAGVNRIGKSGAVEFIGDSIVFDPKGEPLLELQSEQICKAVDISLSELLNYREEFPVLADAP